MKQCPTLSKFLEDNNVDQEVFAQKMNDPSLARYTDNIRANFKPKESLSPNTAKNQQPEKMIGERNGKGYDQRPSKGQQDLSTWQHHQGHIQNLAITTLFCNK